MCGEAVNLCPQSFLPDRSQSASGDQYFSSHRVVNNIRVQEMKCNFLSFWKIAKYLSFSFLHWISDGFFCKYLKILIFMRFIDCQLNQWKINCLWTRKKIESVKNGENFDLCAPGSCPVISNYSKYYLNTWRTMENECKMSALHENDANLSSHSVN